MSHVDPQQAGQGAPGLVEDSTHTSQANGRTPEAYIDQAPLDSDLLEHDRDDEEDDDDDDDDETDEAEYSLSHALDEVNDQDWENASGDLTKRYNRMRQHVYASAAPSAASNRAEQSAPASHSVLPAANSRRKQLESETHRPSGSTNGKAPVHQDKVESALNELAHRFGERINLSDAALGVGVTRKGGSERVLVKDKSDRATNEQVLDPRTRLVLFKMIGRGLLDRIDGCVSTGKEANVYHAVGYPLDQPESKEITHYALKIYKTSILVFKDRDRYVTGEFRFKSGYARSNPRKMVRLWAEKEMRNLRRMWAAGMRCPQPIEVRNNVLVMTFLSPDTGSWEAAPRLKDASLPRETIDTLYVEMLQILRTLYCVCHLVHADLSEYNVLYHQEHLFIIDVSQSVEHDHPHAFDFLRADIKNVEEFFNRRGVQTLGLRETFDFTIGNWDHRDLSLRVIRDELARRLALEHEADQAAEANTLTAGDLNSEHKRDEDAIFAKSFIPRTLYEVYDAERDVETVQRGEGDQLIYGKLTGMDQVETAAQDGIESQSSEDSGSESESDSESDSGGDDDRVRVLKGKKFEDKQAKKDRKTATREERREKRKHKIPKAEKKRRVKKTSGKR
ncbi:uncharacterized protein L969DRAFT_105534 [Mixia osmundae IAM 14324]|uniref:Serine/threonine-protein kinase RIO1 n=1 Tax=Mixia osmundae (strain CBS 9802 / IAM 14324 / JCM 22182 / KY 12970) TaxID=764103 RepID=G7E2A4_MIXOS|nr:uncharacterized protein L969DRAFT_105534 [Mixia osmundae IAM 14324]KEI36837.1 hypothetical protein L969DRAFT_105534 [Mixia osmundae IAM 14324]GAA96964.1 hypothetical protein E5Q_03638 [Mixia osmundae IAM 14324]